jgi:moderate conductance mechanosensitive channel
VAHILLHPARRLHRLFVLSAWLAVILLLTAIASQAQTPEAPAPATPAEAPLKAAEAEQLLQTLEDPGERERLAARLRTLIEARKQVAAPPTPGARILTALADRTERIGQQISEAGVTLLDTPRALRWLDRQVSEPERRATWVRLLAELAVVILAGFTGRGLLLLLILPLRRKLAASARPGLASRLWRNTTKSILELLPILAFVLAGLGVMAAGGAQPVVRQAALAFIQASLLVQLIMVLTRLVLSADLPSLRCVAISDKSALYLTRWIRRLALIAVYGTFLARVAQLLGLPVTPYEGLLKLVGLVVTILLVNIILRNRLPVARWLRRQSDPDKVLSADEANAAALVALASGEAPDASPAADNQGADNQGVDPSPRRTLVTNALRVIWQALVEIWHLLATLYVVGLFGIWALEVEGGLAFVASATLTTLITLMVARLLLLGLDRLSSPGEADGDDPDSRSRRLHWIRWSHGPARLLVWLLAALVLLHGWGFDVESVLFSPAGQRLGTGTFSISLILLLSLTAWELVNQTVSRSLGAVDSSGQPRLRSGRARTLLPLMRTATLVLLVSVSSLMVLSELGLNIAPLLAGAGVVGLAIGFGAQTLVKDVITGLFILFEDTVALGDVIEVGGLSGAVEAISIRTLKLRGYNGTLHTVPFSAVTTVSNMTKDFSYHVLDISVAYESDPDQVMAALQQLAEEMRAEPRFSRAILAPLEIAGLDQFQDSAILIKARIRTRPGQQWLVGRELNRRIKLRFAELGIEIPFPQHTVRIVGPGPLPELAQPSRTASEAETGTDAGSSE